MSDLDDFVVLVDGQDRPVGLMEKLEAHRNGLLHRAFSVIVFDATGNILLQQRALNKYHSRGLWTNTCCSHPRKDEHVNDAAHRRLMEEMNFDCELQKIAIFHYQTPPLDTGLVENELLHLYIGLTDRLTFSPNIAEVMNWRWVAFDALLAEVQTNPSLYSYWLQLYLQDYDLPTLFENNWGKD